MSPSKMKKYTERIERAVESLSPDQQGALQLAGQVNQNTDNLSQLALKTDEKISELEENVGTYNAYAVNVDNRRYYKLFDTNIKTGEKFYINISSVIAWNRLIVCIGGDAQAKRYIDKRTNQNEDGGIFVATEDISEIWMYTDITTSIDAVLEIKSSVAIRDNSQMLNKAFEDIENTGASIIDNDEFVSIAVDSDNRLLESTSKDGKKIFYSDTQFNGFLHAENIINPELYLVKETIIETDDNEFISCTVDSDNRILYGLKADGTFFVQKLEIANNDIYDNIININNVIPYSSGKLSVGACILSSDQNIYPNIDKILHYLDVSAIGVLRASLRTDVPYLHNVNVDILGCDIVDYTMNDSEIVDKITDALIKYNGVPNRYLIIDGNQVGVFVKYWQFFNELDLEWQNGKISTDKVFHLMKLSYRTAKSIRKDVMITCPPVAYIGNNFLRELSAITDSDGNHFWDFFDIFDFHCYSENPERSLNAYINEVRNLSLDTYNSKSASNLIDKPVWLSEFNTISFNYGEDSEAKSMPRWIIMSMAYGIDNPFVYSFINNGTFYHHYKVEEDYFGVVKNSLKNSYMSFLCNDETGNAISVGDDLKRRYIVNEESAHLGLDNPIISDRIKKNGIKISGSGYTISRITLADSYDSSGYHNEQVLWNGTKKVNNEDDVIALSSSLFSSISNTSILVFYFSSVDNVSFDWDCFEPKKSYYALNTISKLIGSRPIVTYDGTLYIAYWYKNNGNKTYAIWDTSAQSTLLINYSGNPVMYNYLGEKIETTRKIVIDNGVTYIDNVESLTIKKI